jgi:hypothetical protein
VDDALSLRGKRVPTAEELGGYSYLLIASLASVVYYISSLDVDVQRFE